MTYTCTPTFPRPQSSDTGPEELLQSLLCLRAEIRSSTSSMTAVPKPLKLLAEHYTQLKEVYLKMVQGQWAIPASPLLFYLEHIKGGGSCSAGRCSLGPSRDSGGQEQRLSPLQTGWLQGEDQLLWAPLYQVVCVIWDWGAYMYIAYKSKIINILITNAFKSQGPQIKVTCICMM